MFYGYLNLESTKTSTNDQRSSVQFYGYLNLESTKTTGWERGTGFGFTVT